MLSTPEVRSSGPLFPLVWGENYVSIELVQLFLNTFSYSDLLVFEAVRKNYCLYTERRWRELRVEDKFNFNWSNTTTEKAHYVQGRVLFSYMTRSLPIFYEKDEVSGQEVYDRLEGVMLCYKSSIGAYLLQDLKRGYGCIQSSHVDSFKFSHPRPIHAQGPAGDLLITGLSFLQQKFRPTKFNEIFENAITQGATCASLLALGTYSKEQAREDLMQIEKWILLSTSFGDYRGLELLLTHQLSKASKYFKLGIELPFVLINYAESLFEKGKYIKANTIWDQAILAYENQVPIQFLLKIAETKFKLDKWDEAEVYFDRGILACTQQDFFIPSSLWFNASSVKVELKKFAEAKVFLEKGEERFLL